MRPQTPRTASRGGHFRCRGCPLLKGHPRPKPRRLPSPAPAANSPPHALSPKSPLPHLTWLSGPQFSTVQVLLLRRADLAPSSHPGVAARRRLPRGGLTARRPPPCVAPTSPNQPQPRAPTEARARASPHLTLLADGTPCCSGRRSPLPPTRPPSSSISTPRPKPTFRARAPCPLSPRANALTRPRPLAASPTAASRARCRRRLYRRRRRCCCTRVLVRRRRLPTDQPSSPVTAAQACYLSPPPSTPALRKRTGPPRAPPSLPPTHLVTCIRNPAPQGPERFPPVGNAQAHPVF